ncbi:MAG: hypothetical protein ACNS61_16775, partial [Candidatus Wenzhouxiangella sp. M2_3B_020]
MKTFPAIRRAFIVMVVLLPLLVGCAARQAQDSLAGSTAQKLVSYSIDDLVRALPDSDFADWRGKSLYLQTHFLSDHIIQRYADRRLAVELARRFDIDVVYDPDAADAMLNVFYTSLATNRDTQGFFLPLGF